MLTRPTAPRHIPALDGIRGIAALMVVWYHYWGSLPGGVLAPGLIARTAVFGQSGVDLFFVLSGFLITRILLAAKGRPHYFRNFHGRRALRIMPLYIGTLVAVYGIVPLLGLRSPVPPREQVWYWLYLQNVASTWHLPLQGPYHFWSLAVEEHFYLAWPFLVALVPRPALGWVSVAIIVVAVASRWMFGVAGLEIGVATFTLCRMDTLAAGTLLAIVEAWDWTARRRAVLLAGGCTCAAALLVLWTHVGGSRAVWLQVFKFTPTALTYACFVGWSALGDVPAWLDRLLGSRGLVFTGMISYGLYVLHPFIIDATPSGWTAAHPALGFAAILSASCLAAYASYRFYERPFLALKRVFGDVGPAT